MVLKSAKLVKQLTAVCCAGVMAASAAACGANTDTRTQITVWSWEPSMKQVIAGFEKDNPDIHVVWKNTSGYDKLNNAIQNGYGIPDVVQLEYYALRQYAVSSQLVPITGRTEGYADFYTPGTWASVQLNGRVYGLPMDSGPMAFFYNNSVFEQVGVDASKIRTWDDYYEAAKKLKKIGVYITADSGDASFYDTMIWLAGGRPFSTSNDLASVAFTGESTSTSPLFSALTAALSSVRKRIATFWVAGLCAVPQYFGLALSTILLAESKDSTVYGPEPTASVFALYLAFLSNTRPGRPVRYHSRLESGVERVSLTVLASTASALSRLATWLAL